MNIRSAIIWTAGTTLAFLAGVAIGEESIGSAFTYQGRLEQEDGPVNGPVEFRFSLWNDETSEDPNDQCGEDVSQIESLAEDGTFTTQLDFGAECFPLEERWLQIAVRIGGEGPFHVLDPRQKITPTPYALRVKKVDNCELTDEMELGSGDPGTAGFLNLYNPLGRITAQLLGDQDGTGALLLNMDTGSPAIALQADDGTGKPRIDLLNEALERLVRVFVHQGAGRIDLIREDGQTGIVLEGSAGEGSILSMRNQTSETNTVLISSGLVGNGGSLSLGNGQEPNRDTVLLDANNSGGTGLLTLRNPSSIIATLGHAGPGTNYGALRLYTDQGRRGAQLIAEPGTGSGGFLNLFDGTSADRITASLAGNDPSGSAGGSRIIMWNGLPENASTVDLDANSGNSGARLALRNFNPPTAFDTIVLDAAASPNAGSILLADSAGQERIFLHTTPRHAASIELRGVESDQTGVVTAQLSAGAGGHLTLCRSDGTPTITLDGIGSDVRVKSQSTNAEVRVLAGQEGIVYLNNASGVATGIFEADGNGLGAVLSMNDAEGVGKIQLLADNPNNPGQALACVRGDIRATGSIIANSGCDLAETFELVDRDAIQPGMVLVMDPKRRGHLTISREPYNRRVAGIVSGAGALQPGVKLGQRVDGSDDLPIALSGRVYCYVDATEHGIEVGDLLTSSSTPGHAMKVTDYDRSPGTVIGKAMEPIAKGRKGMILVLVSLQ
jgi:hypothetical protein